MSLLAESFTSALVEVHSPSPHNYKHDRLAEVFVNKRETPQELPETAFPLKFRILAQSRVTKRKDSQKERH